MKALLRTLAAVAVAVMVVDQVAKLLARRSLELCTAHQAIGCDRFDPVGPLQLIRVRNAGSAFGFLQDLWIWVPLALASLLLVLVYVRTGRAGALLVVAAGLQLGGAFGNIADRLLLGGVTDFIYLGAGPVFNLADLALALGTVLASWSLATGFCPASETLQATQATFASTEPSGSAH